MSAFVVDQYHIDQLVSTGLHGAVDGARPRYNGPLTWYHNEQMFRLEHGTADRVGAMLWGENFASVQFRYPSDEPSELPGPDGITPAYVTFHTYTQPRRRLTAVEAFKAIACYDYQSCEHPGWATSEAAAFCRALEQHLTAALPGYEAAPWELTPGFEAQPTARR